MVSAMPMLGISGELQRSACIWRKPSGVTLIQTPLPRPCALASVHSPLLTVQRDTK